MAIEGLINLADYWNIISSPIFEKLVLAIAAILGGVIVAKLVGTLVVKANRRFRLEQGKALKSLTRLIELMIIVLSIIIALNLLDVNAAQVVVQNILMLIPNLIILLLLLFLGFILIHLIIDLVGNMFIRVGLGDYLEELGFSVTFLNNIFLVIKVFLFLILFSVSFNFVGMALPFIDHILTATIYGFVLLSIGLLYNGLKDPLANFLIGFYIEKNLIKPGQSIQVNSETGEVLGVNAFGTLLKLTTGYNLLIPNKDLIQQKIYIRRTRQDITQLEAIRRNFKAQLPSHCGPASASMMLNFLGYEITQQEIGKLARTRKGGGTGPLKLVDAVKKATGSSVKGVLIRYDEISDLREELKIWLSEGALALLWFNKPALFKASRGRGHYVLCVGVEGDELIIMDPSKATAGVYFVDYMLFEEAMSEFDKKRGYIVFAKKGTSAYWRLSEGLIYSDLSAYQELSKSFERYLRKILRRNEIVHQLLSEHVFTVIGEKEKVRRIWKPNLMKKKKGATKA